MKYLKYFESKQKMRYKLMSAIVFAEQMFNKILINFLNSGYSLNFVDDNNFTPLTAAAYYDRLDHAKKLLKEGANINYPDGNGNTPLMIAAQSNNFNMIQFFIESGANWNINNIDDKDFIDQLDDQYLEIVIENYPDKYENYLDWKNAKKYNL